ncbi:DoxX family protein [Mucilaginibacter conchicola]|uniref:DoxX family protein n=1 Tax=Mucilaginibacter conchicola TaxID=2303333 RepID=A0A372NTQ0_9SPHI|nr:DoxX family protein [Mucilaginibacter conchicola]RFZ92638.1 DoxX family protein [Mucilaginibacter conchicola]
MNTKSIKIIYWILTTLFILAMLGDAYGGITKQQAGQDVLRHLGYPMYLLVICGIFKLFGAIAIAQNKWHIIKEWAFAGFFINFAGAVASRAAMGDAFGELVPPFVMLAIMFILYYFWKQYNKTKTA